MRSLVFLFSSFLLFLSVACTRETDNGRIDGFWQLIEVRQTERQGQSKQFNPKSVYFSFQLELMQIRNGSDTYSATFSFRQDSLFCDTLHYSTFGNDRPLEVDEISSLAHLGINTLTPSYRIATLNSHTLILQAANTSLTFRRY